MVLAGFGGSSNGRTADSDSAYLGSNPSPPANGSKPRDMGKKTMKWNAEQFAQAQAQRTGRRTKLILVIDDDENIRTLVKEVLAPDYRVITASAAAEGIKKLNHDAPDLVFLDIMMPEIDGMTALEFIMKNAPECNVVMLSARSTEENINKVMEIGAKGFLTKPFVAASLMDTIERFVS